MVAAELFCLLPRPSSIPDVTASPYTFHYILQNKMVYFANIFDSIVYLSGIVSTYFELFIGMYICVILLKGDLNCKCTKYT